MQEIFKKSLNQSCRYLQGCSQGGVPRQRMVHQNVYQNVHVQYKKVPEKARGVTTMRHLRQLSPRSESYSSVQLF